MSSGVFGAIEKVSNDSGAETERDGSPIFDGIDRNRGVKVSFGIYLK